jgi:hypothetical protein
MTVTGQVPTPVQTAAVTAAAAFQRRYPKIDPSPDSMRGLVEIFRRTKAGGRAFTPRTGQYIPVHTRAAAAELETLVAFARNPHIARIQVVPSRSGQRTPDFVFHLLRGAVGRFEVTTATGARRGYQPSGGPGTPPSDVDDVVAAVRRKLGGNSQLAVKIPEAPPGGTLVVHLPRGGTEKVVADAMTRLATELKNAWYLHAVQFVLPDSQFTRGGRAPLYVRETQGTYGLAR